MSKHFVGFGHSLGGFLAPEGMTMSDPNHMGRRVLDQGEVAWPEETPFRFPRDEQPGARC